MSIVAVVLTLALVGVLLYLLFRFVPMDPDIRTLIKVVVVIAVVLWLLQVLGVLGLVGSLYPGR
jgi:hypothetical protein